MFKKKKRYLKKEKHYTVKDFQRVKLSKLSEIIMRIDQKLQALTVKSIIILHYFQF